MVGSRHLAFSGDDVQGEVLHGRVEDLLHGAGQPVDLVDKQHVPGAQVGEQSRQVPRLLNGRAAGNPQIHPQLVGHDPRQGGLAQAGRAVKQHVVQGLLPALGGLDVDLQVLLDLVLAHIVGKSPGAQGVFHRLVLRSIARLHHAVFKVQVVVPVGFSAVRFHRHEGSSFRRLVSQGGHLPLPKPFKARRISSSGGRVESSLPTAAAASLAE